jgi:hypothetical protein
MHPRLLAFGAGGLAVAACLHQRSMLAIVFVVVALALHPTTAVWFALWVGIALAAGERRLRLPAVAAGLLATGGGLWALVAGPLAGRLARMDEAWLSVLGPKQYLFATDWPASAWSLAVLYPLVIALVFAVRRRRTLAANEGGLVIGAGALFAVFLASLPFAAARMAMAVQLQVPRVLWLLDLMAVSYLVWYLAEGAPWAGRSEPPETGTDFPARSRRGGAARVVALALVAISLGRGAYVMLVEHPERPLVQVGLQDDEWNAAMRWIQANTAKNAWILAPPGHAWKYGTSVRVAAQRDVYLEEAKDTAMAMYSRDAALTVLARIHRAIDVDRLTAAEARLLAADIGLDVLVTEQRLDLPLLYSNSRFSVYSLR